MIIFSDRVIGIIGTLLLIALKKTDRWSPATSRPLNQRLSTVGTTRLLASRAEQQLCTLN